MKKFLLILAGILLAAGVFFALKVQSFYNQINTKKSVLNILDRPVEKTDYNLLLLGYGGGSHEGTYLTDTIMVAHIDTKTKKIVLISLPRDLWVKLPTDSGDDFHAKINSVYEIGLFPDTYPDVKVEGKDKQAAADLVKGAVTEITGLPIDYYAAIDFAGFVKAVDLLGGLDINVEKTFDDFEYPIEGKEDDLCGKDEDFKKIEKFLKPTLTPDEEKERDEALKDKTDLEKFYRNITEEPNEAFPCRYEHLHFDKGLQHMDGETALKYSRSRHSAQDGDDFGRAARQQRTIQAVKDKVFTISFLPKIIPLMDELKNNIKTDLDPTLIKKFNDAAKKNESYVISSAVPNLDQLQSSYSDAGQFILISTEGVDKWTGLQSWLKNVIAGITPTPTKSLKPTISIRSPSPTPTL